MPSARNSAPLRAVEANESKPKRAMTLQQAAARGSELDVLVALRRRTAKVMDDPKCTPRDFAALSRRLMELSESIAALRGGGSDGDDDEGEPERPGSGAAAVDEDWDPEAL